MIEHKEFILGMAVGLVPVLSFWIGWMACWFMGKGR
jgi:hypothetical protein